MGASLPAQTQTVGLFLVVAEQFAILPLVACWAPALRRACPIPIPLQYLLQLHLSALLFPFPVAFVLMCSVSGARRLRALCSPTPFLCHTSKCGLYACTAAGFPSCTLTDSGPVAEQSHVIWV